MSGEINEDALIQIKELMGDKFSGLVEVYLRASREHVENLRSGFEAGDAQKIVDSAHPMKSSSGNMGLAALSQSAMELEELGRGVVKGDKDIDVLGGLITQVETLFASGEAYLKDQA